MKARNPTNNDWMAYHMDAEKRRKFNINFLNVQTNFLLVIRHVMKYVHRKLMVINLKISMVIF